MADIKDETAMPTPESAAECFAAAEKFLDNGLYDQAIHAYRRGLEQEPDNPAARNGLAMVYIEKGDYAAARQELERALALREGVDILANLGYVLRKLGDEIGAAAYYERYLALAPQAEDADAIRRWLEKVRSAPQLAPAAGAGESEILSQAEAAYDAEEYEKALGLYNRALEINVDSAAALAGRGRCQAKLGLWEEALASLKEATALAPEESENWFVMGVALRKLERETEAAEALEKFLSLAPDDERAEKIRAFIAALRSKAQPQPPAEEPGAAPLSAEEEGEVVEPSAPPEPPPAVAEPQAEAGAMPVLTVKETVASESSANLTIEQRLAVIRDDLEKGDADVALAKAQELVGQHPDCTDGKILIARCFGKKSEFGKAAVILENILGSEDTNEEALFLLGRCQQEMGKAKEARATFERCRAMAKDEERKARLEEILRAFSAGGKGICASCAESVPQSQLQEVNGRRVCPNCRQRLESALGGQAAIMTAEAPAEKQPTSSLKPPAYRRPGAPQGAMARVGQIAALLLVAAAAVGGGMYLFFPEFYEALRNRLPASWPLPTTKTAAVKPPKPTPPKPAQGEGGATIAAAQQTAEPQKSPTPGEEPLTLIVPETATAMAEFAFTLKVQIAEKTAGTKYSIECSRQPAQPYKFDANTGEFLWTPSAADCGEPFILTFGAICGEHRAENKRCTLTVRTPLRIKPLGIKMETAPGAVACLAAGDLDGDGQAELFAAAGDLWQSTLVAFSPAAEGYAQTATLTCDGRPLAMAVADFGQGRRLAFVDYWHSAIRFIAWKEGNLVPCPEKVVLPGRPALAAFGNPDGKDGEGVAVLCPQQGKIFVYDASKDGLALAREISVPTAALWKSLMLVDFFGGDQNSWAELALVRAGQVQPNLYFSPVQMAGDWIKCNIGSGVTQGVSALATADAITSLGLVAAQREANLYWVAGRKNGEAVKYETISLKTNEPLLAMAAADVDGDQQDDIALFFRHGLQVRLASSREAYVKEFKWPEGVKPPLGPAIAIGRGETEGVIWWDRAGDLLFLASEGR